MATRKFGGPNGYGHVSDPVDHKKTSFRVMRMKLATVFAALATLPQTIDFKPFVVGNGGPGIINQKATSSCTGHATGGSVTTRMAIVGAPVELVSPIGSYALSRALDRIPNADGSLPPLTDDGAMPNQNMRALVEFGCPPASVWGNYPADPATINDEPTIKELEAASAFEMTGFYAIDSTGDQKILDIMTALAAGFPVCFAVQVDSDFENYVSGVVGAPNPNDILGGHYIYAVGYSYDGKDPKSIEVTFVNSWDTTWGEGGFGRGNADFIAGMSDLYVMDVHAKAADQAA